jgi:cell wall-associated NlpC family hydrolase
MVVLSFGFISCSTSPKNIISTLQKKQSSDIQNFKKSFRGKMTSQDSAYIAESNQLFEKKVLIIETAFNYLGTPHKIGGRDSLGIDCSGLTCNSFEAVGIKLPRTAFEQGNFGESIPLEKVLEGDLLFFAGPNEQKIDHVGIVITIGEKQFVEFIHASTSKGVRRDNLNNPYWKKNFKQARRILIDNE